MKMYCCLALNEITNDVEHCVSSNTPVSKKMIPTTAIENNIKTIPATQNKKLIYCFCELECNTFVRGREVMNCLGFIGGKLECKANPRFTLIKETDEKTMLKEYNSVSIGESDEA